MIFASTARVIDYSSANPPDEGCMRMEGTIRAPEFPEGYLWINTDKPLRLAHELRGQIVLLDFWTYCCINCMHVLAELERLEARYKNDPFVVVGVHSAKFLNETSPENIAAAVKRYNIKHPVIIDQRMRIWNEYAVRAWPSLVLIGPDGKIVGGVSGEGHEKVLISVIDRLLTLARESDRQGKSLAGPITFPAQLPSQPPPLSFPAKIIADEKNARIFVVDSNYNRVVIATLPDDAGNSQLIETIGSGEKGALDGNFAQAQFHRPQGAALAGDTLFIADTENHLIRAADLKRKTVRTLLGTGKQLFDPEAGKTGRDQPLNSPWDVAVDGNRLYISMAGQHQIFSMNLLTHMAEILAGSGRENIADDESLEANLAQPSGLAIDTAARRLYFVDAEVSAVRYVDLKANRVETLIGTGLFDFGDADGQLPYALLQHPLGLSRWKNGLLIADTYNHKIKFLDLDRKQIETIPLPPDFKFSEPASITASGEKFFVADTNNHRVMMRNETGNWRELAIERLTAPACAGGVCVP
jgi:thiol-disulfide isomerase/thioredoxin